MKTQILRKKHTGRNLLLLNENFKTEIFFSTARKASLNIAHFNDYKDHPYKFGEAFTQSDGIYFETLKVAVLNELTDDKLGLIKKSFHLKPIITEPERYIFKINSNDYLKGFNDGVNSLTENFQRNLLRSLPSTAIMEFQQPFTDTEKVTWGIKAIKVLNSKYTGKGIKIAILDTGLFDKHNDIKERNIIRKAFIENSTPDDKDGHGTHCTGIACGFKDANGLRYGVAYKSDIFCAKVLNDNGEGTDSSILAAIEWAIDQKCQVISMSLGAPCEVNEPYSEVYENVAKRAMKHGSLIIAAAGNESRRPSYIAPVGHPANCPSILAVGAVDNKLLPAFFSCGGINPDGGQVDIVAPGTSIYSMINAQNKHEKWDGTSMATPFVSGIAALYFEKNKTASPSEIWTLLSQNARRLDVSSSDVGSGLVQAPKKDKTEQ